MTQTSTDAASASPTPLEILERLEGRQVEVRQDPVSGKFLPKGESPATVNASPQEPVAPVVKEDESAQETTAAPEMGKALTALRRARTPQSVIDKLTDSERLEWGTSLAKQQADTDRLYRSKGKDPATAEGASARAADATSGEAGSPTPDAEAEQGIDPVFAQMRDILAEQARSRLAAQMPQLNDPKVWADVYAKSKELMESGAYDELSDNWSEIADTIVSDALASTKHRPNPTAPSPARVAGNTRPTNKAEDPYASLKGTPSPLLRLRLMEDPYNVPAAQVDAIARRLGA